MTKKKTAINPESDQFKAGYEAGQRVEPASDGIVAKARYKAGYEAGKRDVDVVYLRTIMALVEQLGGRVVIADSAMAGREAKLRSDRDDQLPGWMLTLAAVDDGPS